MVNVHHFASQVTTAIAQHNGWGSAITISDETEEVLETGGGLKKAAWYFEAQQHFVLMNADVLTNLDLTGMIAQHLRSGALATLAVSRRETSRYFLFDDHNRLCGWQNIKTAEVKPAGVQPHTLKPLAFSGIHVISRNLLPLMQQQGKFSMVDVYLQLCSTHLIMAYDHTGCKFADVGKPESIAQAEAMFA